MGVRGTCDSENHLILVNCLLCGFLRLNARNRGGDGGFARVIVGGLRLLFLLRRFTGFGAGNRRFDGGFTRVDRCFGSAWRCCAALRALARAIAASTAALRGSTGAAQPCCCSALRALARAIAASTAALRGSTALLPAGLRFTGFGAGNRRFDGGFARRRFALFRPRARASRARQSLRCYPVCPAGITTGWAAWLFLANARQCGVNRILIFLGRLNGGLLMALLTGAFSRSSRA
jgi:hypothetical protein